MAANPKLAPPFTKANAKVFAARGNAIRWSADSRAARIVGEKRKLAGEEPPDDYRERRLLRVRAQLDLVDRRMMTERDPQRLDRFASAQSRLAEQERQLSGRPMPGSLKPSVAKGSRSRSEVATAPTESQHNSQVESQNSQVDIARPKHDPDEPNG